MKTKTKVKKVKGWAVIDPKIKVGLIFESKKKALLNCLAVYQNVIPVLITPLSTPNNRSHERNHS